MHARRLFRHGSVLLLGLALFGCTSTPPHPSEPASVTTPPTDSVVKPDIVAPPPTAAPATAEVALQQTEAAKGRREQQALPRERAEDHRKMAAPVGGAMATLMAPVAPPPMEQRPMPSYVQGNESYAPSQENPFVSVHNHALSTFSIDVDTASYSNVRRLITSGKLPPVGAVRIEEMVNYFSYDYPEPKQEPFAISTELGPCPWEGGHQLVRIGLKAKDLDKASLPPSNLIFLVDVSGSMNQANKLPLLKKSMLMLVDQMTDQDRIGIVVYAGSDRVVLPPTPGSRRQEIVAAIDSLSPGGSTHASRGIITAYQLAEQSFMPKGNNRVILASDGDFNVGVTSRDELKRLIEDKRKSGVYLTVLGFGMGNYHDDTMEILADAGNGNYAYIDSLLEAKKVLIKERGSNLFAQANDVKIQVEFNPAQVGAFRLIGYENRMLADEDFKNDAKDAGEVGPGQRVTALYELIPAGAAAVPAVDELKYQKVQPRGDAAGEVLTVKIRYKPLGQNSSVEQRHSLPAGARELARTSDDFRFAAAVAGFGMLLKQSEHKGQAGYPLLLELARQAKGKDDDGYRAEFIKLLETSELLTR
ncbi:MAG: hypothetical protein BWK76_01110 [Desulfobulbaceae bacterium A2]|nr:MAG: hypothetical protein BWK76_01110 [Desulfobulbaceae bacterium A2]